MLKHSYIEYTIFLILEIISNSQEGTFTFLSISSTNIYLLIFKMYVMIYFSWCHLTLGACRSHFLNFPETWESNSIISTLKTLLQVANIENLLTIC